MSAPPWRERREAYLRECGRSKELIREGYVESALVVIAGGRRRCKREQSPALLLVTDKAVHREAKDENGG